MWIRKEKAQEDVFVAASPSRGETEDVLEGRALSVALSPDLLTPAQSLSSCSVYSGAEAATTSAALGPSSSPFFSARIQSLGERRDELGSDSEFEIEASQCHWTETSVATSDFDDEDQRIRDEKQRVADSIAFEKLKEHPEWGPFFQRRPYKLEIGGKIAEGGQATIFEALGTIEHEDGSHSTEKLRLVVKVFKKGLSLEDMQRLWPPGLGTTINGHQFLTLLMGDSSYIERCGLCFSLGAQLLDDGRFAFIFDRFWGDFRKRIDRRMLESNGSPPFSFRDTYNILRNIAEGMGMLHKGGFLHRDLKTANVLAVGGDTSSFDRCSAFIADFESSVGIAGTGFWRAPEVLLALKNRSFKDETFTQKCDVYSYAMTCYEVLTGRIPFEGHPTNDYDLILRGERPPLPDAIHPFFKDLVRKCWHGDPLQRPSFDEIGREFHRYLILS